MPHIYSSRRKPEVAATTVLVLLLACLGLAACGGSSSSSSSSTAALPRAQARGRAPKDQTPGRFAAMRECLQKNGITLPKRTPGQKRPSGGAGGFLGGGAGGAGPKLPKRCDARTVRSRDEEVRRRQLRRSRRHPLQKPRLPGGAREVRDLPAPERRERASPEHLGQRPRVRHQRHRHEQRPVQSGRGQVPERPERSVPARARRRWISQRQWSTPRSSSPQQR